MQVNEQILSDQSPIRVLLVEDNPGDSRLIQELISESASQFEVHSVGRLAEALERLKTGDYQLVLVDLSLPDSHGIDTFHKVVERAPDVPLIVMSGLDDEVLALQTVREGAQDYLVKGNVDRQMLVRSMRYALKRAEADKALADEAHVIPGVPSG